MPNKLYGVNEMQYIVHYIGIGTTNTPVILTKEVCTTTGDRSPSLFLSPHIRSEYNTVFLHNISYVASR